MLLADKDQLARALTEKLLSYATGAVPTTGDRAEIEEIVRNVAGTNYGFLNGKPGTRSILDVLGPWPWYILVEIVLVLSAWALMTWPWEWVARQRNSSS